MKNTFCSSSKIFVTFTIILSPSDTDGFIGSSKLAASRVPMTPSAEITTIAGFPCRFCTFCTVPSSTSSTRCFSTNTSKRVGRANRSVLVPKSILRTLARYVLPIVISSLFAGKVLLSMIPMHLSDSARTRHFPSSFSCIFLIVISTSSPSL